MIDLLKPYSDYKDSGLPWLGKIPSHWNTPRTKARFRLRTELSGTAHGKELLSVYTHIGVRPRKDLEERGNKASSTDNYWAVYRGDIVCNKLLAWMGAIGVSQFDGVTSPAYDILQSTRPLVPEYYHELFRTRLYLSQFKANSRGIMDMRLRLYFDQFGQIPIIEPPVEEQSAIVKFLAALDRRVNRFVKAKRWLIALLTEQKQAIITQAVARGLNPNAKLKPSGIDWLGDIPAHWEVRKLKHLAKMESGESITSLTIEAAGAYPVFGGNGLRGYTTAFTHDGDYALIGRQGALCGNVNFVSGKFWASEHAVVPTLRPNVHVHWFAELIRTMNLRQYSQSAAQPGLAIEMISNLSVPLPTLNEQLEIAASIVRQARCTIDAMETAQREIDLIREYRTRLVADVVTGKLDVRAVVAKMPTEDCDPTETLELLDNETDENENIEDLSSEEVENV